MVFDSDPGSDLLLTSYMPFESWSQLISAGLLSSGGHVIIKKGKRNHQSIITAELISHKQNSRMQLKYHPRRPRGY